MVPSKLSASRRGIFAQMGDLAEKHNAINMALPMSDFPCPPELIKLVTKYMELGYNNYSPTQGVLPLRKQIVKKMSRLYDASYDVESEITITTGTVQAITTAINAYIKEGDEVLLFEPAIDSFAPAIEVNGGRAKYMSLKRPDFHIDWNEVKMMITSKTRMIILGSPQNPTGRVLTKEDIDQLKKITNGTNIVIICNETFEHLVFDEEKHLSLSEITELRSRCLVVSSTSALYQINGWGVAYVLGDKKLMAEYMKFQQFMGHSVNTPAQYAIAEYLEKDKLYNELSEQYQGKRNYFLRLLKDSNFDFVPSKGTYYQILDYSKISDEPDVEFATRLVEEYGVAGVPISVFEHEKGNKSHLIRFCFAKPNDVLEKAAELLCSIPAKESVK